MKNPQIHFSFSKWETNGRLFGFGTSPEADWKIILITTAILAVLVTALSIYMFIEIDNGEIFVVEKSAEQVQKPLDLDILRKTVLYYQNKAAEFEKITNPK